MASLMAEAIWAEAQQATGVHAPEAKLTRNEADIMGVSAQVLVWTDLLDTQTISIINDVTELFICNYAQYGDISIRLRPVGEPGHYDLAISTTTSDEGTPYDTEVSGLQC